MIHAADLFCGAGGTSTGLLRACASLNLRVDLLAINHWNVAIATHMTNHPDVRHLCETLDAVDPIRVVPGGHLDIMLASPECRHHSNARGGKPRYEQSRASAWHILRWCEALRVDNVIIENVSEFQTWGPLDNNGNPIKERKGETYRAFLTALESLGYRVESRILNAADFGDHTTRKRLFIMARRGGRRIEWPEPTHSNSWRPAREIIDWGVPAASIFNRKRPLAPATLARIAAGLRKFGGKQIEPFLVVFRNHQDASSINAPVPTLTTSGANFGLCQPFMLQQQSGGAPRSTDQPVPTIATKGAISLVQAFLVEYHGTHAGREDGQKRVKSVEAPLPTQDTSNRFGLVEPFLVKYYRTGKTQSLNIPIDTITARDRFGLVMPKIDGMALDIHFRMLQPHELARAMSFPDDYRFAGNREAKVKQIGNAVPVRIATALCKAMLEAA